MTETCWCLVFSSQCKLEQVRLTYWKLMHLRLLLRSMLCQCNTVFPQHNFVMELVSNYFVIIVRRDRKARGGQGSQDDEMNALMMWWVFNMTIAIAKSFTRARTRVYSIHSYKVISTPTSSHCLRVSMTSSVSHFTRLTTPHSNMNIS